jgi:bifunctional N-acetylglucosamine-1-phosphate-uridyltransferase/glucosamine-1-phosphate-acetyltransferase GlmU-like protein
MTPLDTGACCVITQGTSIASSKRKTLIARNSPREANTGVLATTAGRLRRWLSRLNNDNAQGEYYLTDVITLAVRDGMKVQAVPAPTIAEVLGVNDRSQLAQLEADCRRLCALIDARRRSDCGSAPHRYSR